MPMVIPKDKKLDKFGGWKWMEISHKAWEFWCDKNNCELVVYDKPSIEDTNKYRITVQRWFDLFEFVDNKGIEYDNYLRTSKFVNLLNVNKQGLYLSENSYSLKNVEKFYNFKRDGDVQKGDVSQDYYSEWIETQEQYYLDEIEKYNKEDCRSTYELHQWLLSIKPGKTSWFTTDLEDEVIELKDFEIEMLNYQTSYAEIL